MGPLEIILIVIGIIFIIYLLIAIYQHHKLFGKRWDPDGIIEYYSAFQYLDLMIEDVKFNLNNQTLRGYFYFYEKENYKGILVFSHGMWGSHEAYIQEIELLAREGYKVLGFDYLGTDLSDGKNIKGLGMSLRCLDAAIKYVKSISDEKIYVMGHSWGGFAASNIAKYHNDIAAVVAMSPFVSISRLLSKSAPLLIKPFIPFFILIDWINCGTYSFSNSLKVLKKSNVPTLILHSKDDHVVDYYKNTYVLEKRIKRNNLKFIILNGKKHNPDYSDDALQYALECNKEMSQLKGEKLLIYRMKIDYQRMGEIDNNVFSKIIDFLNNH